MIRYKIKTEKNMLKETINGQRIILKRPNADIKTAEEVFSSIDRCRDIFLPWLGWVKYTNSVNDSLDFLNNVDKDWNDNKQFVYAIYLDSVFIGLISILNIAQQHKRAEIGYWLDTKYTGKGYMQEAVSLVETELFNNNFNRLVIHTDVLNIKSANVARKMGYIHEGILRQEIYSEPNNRYRDINVFSKLKSDR